MQCQKCGNDVADGVRFCTKCGAPMNPPGADQSSAPAGKREKKRKASAGTLAASIIAAALAVVLVLQNFFGLPLAGGRSGGAAADAGYESPEKLMESFGRTIAANDLDGAVNMFGCTLRAENYDCGAMIERMQAWMPGLPMPYASTDTIFAEANRERLRGDAAEQISNLCFSLQADEDMLAGSLVQGDGEGLADLADEILDDSSLEDLKTFKVLRIDYVMPDTQDSTGYQKTMEAYCDIYGADEMKDYGVLYEYDGETYAGGVSLICYGNKWYISSLTSALMGTTSFGYLTPADKDEYLDMVE